MDIIEKKTKSDTGNRANKIKCRKNKLKWFEHPVRINEDQQNEYGGKSSGKKWKATKDIKHHSGRGAEE